MPNNPVIAIVDDDASVREALTGLLKSCGRLAIAFEHAEDFLNSDQRRDASCLIADVQMPDMSGPELYNRLIASGHPIPTVFITAYPDPIARTRALQNGAICYLSKPLLQDEFLACIDLAISASEAKGERARPDKDENGCRATSARP